MSDLDSRRQFSLNGNAEKANYTFLLYYSMRPKVKPDPDFCVHKTKLITRNRHVNYKPQNRHQVNSQPFHWHKYKNKPCKILFEVG